jgi:hypothetical protein
MLVMMKLPPLTARPVRWLLLPALLLAACRSAAAPTAVVQAPTLAPVVISTTLPTAVALVPTTAAPAATEPGMAVTTDAPPATIPPEPTIPAPTFTPFVISDEFTPSDPATVNLAAGQPQLVEFFAFW